MKLQLGIVLIFALLDQTWAISGRKLAKGSRKDRKLILTLDRNQKYYRQEDRQRCELNSPGRNESTDERTNAETDNQDAVAENRIRDFQRFGTTVQQNQSAFE